MSTSERMDDKSIENMFQLAPLALKLLSSLETGSKDSQQRLSTLIVQRIQETRKFLENLPNGDLTSEQQQKLLEFYEERLQRKT